MIPFLILISLFVLAAALGAVWKAEPGHSALFLVLSLILNGMLYLVVSADFMEFVQLMTYVGGIAIVVVLVLVLKPMNNEVEEKLRRRASFLTGFCCMLPLVGVLGYAVFQFAQNEVSVSGSSLVISLDKLDTVFLHYAPMGLSVLILLTAMMIVAALFAREPRQNTFTNRMNSLVLLSLFSVCYQFAE